MAIDMIRVMEALGFSRFVIFGHNRGARVAYRLALDHPGRVERLAVLDVIPVGEALQRADARFTVGFWPWSLLAQPAPLPEQLISSTPDAVIDDALTNWGSSPRSFPDSVRSAYIEALRNRESVHSICEEYRAAATLDWAHDCEDRAAGRRIVCPTLVLWSEQGPLDTWYETDGGPLGIWGEWAVSVSGRAIRGRHFFPEENPTETAAELLQFMNRR